MDVEILKTLLPTPFTIIHGVSSSPNPYRTHPCPSLHHLNSCAVDYLLAICLFQRYLFTYTLTHSRITYLPEAIVKSTSLPSLQICCPVLPLLATLFVYFPAIYFAPFVCVIGMFVNFLCTLGLFSHDWFWCFIGIPSKSLLVHYWVCLVCCQMLWI